jgi:mannose-6-phosphate isomerase
VKAELFRIDSTFSPRIWGARSLAPLYPEKTNLPEPIGEAWLTDVNCRIANGPFAGKTLQETWREMPSEWRGRNLANLPHFPLLVKFLFPTDKLSIQVHPDDAYAAAHEKAAGGRGKTEMWHIISAEPGAKVLAGFKPGVTREKFLAALEAHTLEDLLLAWPVAAGDAIFVPARTSHSIGPGLILCEVQEYSDLTYRVYDYGRVDSSGKPRELHIEKALAVLNFGKSKAGKVAALHLPAKSGEHFLLAACPYFATELWNFKATLQKESRPAQFDLFVVLSGSGYLHWEGSPLPYRRGECWFIPASLGRFSLQPEQSTSVIQTSVPDLAALRSQLVSAGISPVDLARNVFD